jgi:hypothetical protein
VSVLTWRVRKNLVLSLMVSALGLKKGGLVSEDSTSKVTGWGGAQALSKLRMTLARVIVVRVEESLPPVEVRVRKWRI